MGTKSPSKKPEILFDPISASQTNGQCDCSDCDCACAPIANPLTLPENIIGSQWKIAPSLSFVDLNKSHSILFNPDNPVSMAVLNQVAIDMLNSFKTSKSADDLKFEFSQISDSDVEESVLRLACLNLIIRDDDHSPQIKINPQSKTLTIWLHLTERCNLRCAYCYLPHRARDMRKDIGKAIIDISIQTARKYGYSKIKLKYAGGEPLLKFSLILELHQYAQACAQASGLQLEGVILSNGTLLTASTAREIASAGLRLMISLDGMSESHDKQRTYASGQGTHKDVLQGIKNARQEGLTPDISVTISGRNADGLANLVDWILEEKLPFGLNFYRENDLSACKANLSLENENIIAGMRAAFKVIEQKMPTHNLLASVMDRANLSMAHKYTCSAGQDYLVFDQDGQVSKCQMLMNVKVGSTLPDDPLSIVCHTDENFQNLSVDSKKECNQCKWRYWCAGGCPLATHRATGQFDRPSPYCQIYKKLYPDVLRLEGLRLLKADTQEQKNLQ